VAGTGESPEAPVGLAFDRRVAGTLEDRLAEVVLLRVLAFVDVD
jgi:hypothetical protein